MKSFGGGTVGRAHDERLVNQSAEQVSAHRSSRQLEALGQTWNL